MVNFVVEKENQEENIGLDSSENKEELDNSPFSEAFPAYVAEATSAEEAAKENKKKDFNPKTILAFLTIFVVLGLFFTVSNWFDRLEIPFALKSSDKAANLNLSLADSDVANLLAMQQKDTDLDGLSDYDELYVYQTSPYLPDTDSDGFLDFEEIQNNQDPNCPAGQDCGTGFETKGVTPELPGLSADLPVEQIRLLLIQGGMTEEQVNAIDDETLRQLYLETLEETEDLDTGEQTFKELSPETLDLITPAQLRAILREQGLNEEDLNDLSDDDLKLIWEEIIKLETGS